MGSRRIPERDDPELGRMRLCRGCAEEWPKDPEFWFYDNTGNVLGHCRACWSERRRAKYRAERAVTTANRH